MIGNFEFFFPQLFDIFFFDSYSSQKGYLMDLMDDVDDTLSTISSSSPPPPSSSSSSSSTPARDNEKVTSTNVYFKNCEFCVRGESDGFVLQVFISLSFFFFFF